MSKIIVGVDGSEGSADAIRLASRLAASTTAPLVFVNVFPYELHPTRAGNGAFREYLHRDSEDLLERLRSTHGDDTVEVRAVANPSTAHGLHALAEREDAGLIVVGSTHTGPLGRVLPGSTAERLLHGAPCTVAVAPKGYAAAAAGEPAVIGCGFDGGPSSARALEAARRMTAASGAHLRVIRAFRPLAYDVPPGSVALGSMSSYNDDLRERAEAELVAAVSEMDMEPRPEAKLVVGEPGRVLAKASEELDLLLVGSRGYGPMHAVVVGGVAGRLVREAACPVVVFPRTAGRRDAPPQGVVAEIDLVGPASHGTAGAV